MSQLVLNSIDDVKSELVSKEFFVFGVETRGVTFIKLLVSQCDTGEEFKVGLDCSLDDGAPTIAELNHLWYSIQNRQKIKMEINVSKKNGKIVTGYILRILR